ncbi:hypothetical protein B0H14DRAFT_3141998 [Mycena olivaceomarginata]|nr:hypothetical protein B0H14DRAFT_3141998 [Mycena olivaceomarginata]
MAALFSLERPRGSLNHHPNRQEHNSTVWSPGAFPTGTTIVTGYMLFISAQREQARLDKDTKQCAIRKAKKKAMDWDGSEEEEEESESESSSEDSRSRSMLVANPPPDQSAPGVFWKTYQHATIATHGCPSAHLPVLPRSTDIIMDDNLVDNASLVITSLSLEPPRPSLPSNQPRCCSPHVPPFLMLRLRVYTIYLHFTDNSRCHRPLRVRISCPRNHSTSCTAHPQPRPTTPRTGRSTQLLQVRVTNPPRCASRLAYPGTHWIRVALGR